MCFTSKRQVLQNLHIPTTQVTTVQLHYLNIKLEHTHNKVVLHQAPWLILYQYPKSVFVCIFLASRTPVESLPPTVLLPEPTEGKALPFQTETRSKKSRKSSSSTMPTLRRDTLCSSSDRMSRIQQEKQMLMEEVKAQKVITTGWLILVIVFIVIFLYIYMYCSFTDIVCWNEVWFWMSFDFFRS